MHDLRIGTTSYELARQVTFTAVDSSQSLYFPKTNKKQAVHNYNVKQIVHSYRSVTTVIE